MTGRHTESKSTGTLIFSWAIFLLPALALSMRIGVGLIEATILLGALFYAKPLWSQRRELFTPSRWIIIAFAFYLVVALTSMMWSGFEAKFLDYPLRLLLVLTAIGIIVLTQPKVKWFWYGLFVGTVSAASIAIYQRFEMDMARAEGFHMAIMFGDVAIAMGIISLAGISIFARTRWAALPYLTFLAGVTASILSGSRGGWIALMFSVIPLYSYGRRVAGKRTLLIVSAGVTLLIGAYFIPELGVQERLNHVSTEIYQYKLGDANTSVGARLEMWKAAGEMFAEHPILGVGRAHFNDGLSDLIARGKINPAVADYQHAHNELFHALATEGVIGGIALLFLYAAPFIFFMRQLKQDGEHQPYALAGVLLVLSFIDFGLTQVLFAHHIGSAFYALTISVLAGICTACRQTAIEPSNVADIESATVVAMPVADQQDAMRSRASA